MAENKLHVRGHYSEKEINDKLEWSISLLHELVVSIDDIGHVGHTLGKAARLDAALASARRALGLPEPLKSDVSGAEEFGPNPQPPASTESPARGGRQG